MSFRENKFTQNWKEAQQSIAFFLERNNFLVWEERSIKNKRIDILAKRLFKDQIFNLIFEVKHYNTINASEEDKFLEQLEEYLRLFIIREVKRKGIRKITSNSIFIGYLVLSKDYGLHLNRKKNWRKKDIFDKDSELSNLWKNNVFLFCSSQEFIQTNLESIGLTFYSQSKLSDFFENNNNSKKEK